MGRTTAAAIGAAVLAAAIGAGSANAQKPGGTLRVYHRDTPPSASIHEEATISTTFPFASVFNNLIMYDPDQAKETEASIVPELAERWRWDATRTQLTFDLRPGVKWHDGRPFTAKDVACTWDLINGTTEGARKSPRRIWYDNVDKIAVDGELQVTFRLKAEQPSFLSLLASGLTPIYPCHVSAKDMRAAPVGTGPFKFGEFKRNDVIRVVKNPDYWKPGLPYLDGIEFRIIPNRSTRVLAFIADEFDLTFAGDVTVPLMKDIDARAPSARCELYPSGDYANLMVNRSAPPFDSAEIRRAMSLALDRAAFNTILGEGRMSIGGAMMPGPEGAWGMPADVQSALPGYSTDVEANRAEARKILEGLGYTKDKPLKLKVTTRGIDLFREPAVILVDQLKSINIEAELAVVDTTVWFGILQRKDYAVAMNVTGVGVDSPDANLVENYLCKSERNFTNYCNPDLEALIAAQSKESDIERRKRIVWDIERKLVEDAARPVIFHLRTGTCWYPRVRGLMRHQNGLYNQWRFETVWLDL